MNPLHLCEAYAAVYDEELREDLILQEDNLEFIDDLTDNELVEIMEEILVENEVTLQECFDVFESELISEESEMERMNRLSNKRTRERKSAEATAKRMKSAERERVGRKHAIKRLQVAATKAGRNLSDTAKGKYQRAKTLGGGAVSAIAGGAAEAGRKAQRGAEKVKGKLASAKERIKGFIKSGRKAAAGGLRNLASRIEPKEKSTQTSSKSSNRPALPPARTRTVSTNRRSVAASKLAAAAAGTGSSGTVHQGQPAGTFKSKKSRAEAQKREARLTAKESFELLDLLIDDLIAEGYVNTESEAYDLIENLDINETFKIVESYLVEETVDLYDVVLEHLIEKGFVDDEESATIVMANMSEEWREEIIEQKKKSYSVKQARAGHDIGKPGKMFAKIERSGSARYGKGRGAKIAGAVLKNLRAKH